MKIAVIGGGTAGYMAASHFSRNLAHHEMFHIYDSRIPVSGVGEGTIPIFVDWLHEMTGLCFSALQERCGITRKWGIQFENWGTRRSGFRHDFYSLFGYHISASRILDVLKDCVSAGRMDRKVRGIVSDGRRCVVEFDEGSQEFDFVIDARGFPGQLGAEHELLPLIPTDAAALRPVDRVFSLWGTRSVARPHGWIFVIPLADRTSYGYIYNSRISSAEEIEADYDAFFTQEGLESAGTLRTLRFPNFLRKVIFDGALFYVGNSASFLEPLEATALAVAQIEIETACAAIALKERGALDVSHIIRMNADLAGLIQRVAYFIGWHYSGGSPYDTPFWRSAGENFRRYTEAPGQAEVRDHFEMFFRMAGAVASGGTPLVQDVMFAIFGLESFIQMGEGLGYL